MSPETFHKAHQVRYGYSQTENKVEIVSARLRSLGLVDELMTHSKTERTARKLATAKRYVSVYLENRKTRAAVYSRDRLDAGMHLKTPCIVTEYSATTLVPAKTRATIDGEGNLVIDL